MMKINPITSQMFCSAVSSENSMAEPLKEKAENSNKDAWLSATLVGLSAIGVALLALQKGKAASFQEALDKNGVVIKDKIAYLKDSGEKFTGFIMRNSKAFGRETETVWYENGVLQEKLYRNLSGDEIHGLFYRDGKLFRDARPFKDNLVQCFEYGEDLKVQRTIVIERSKSFFEQMRGDIPGEKSGLVFYD